MRPWAVAVSPEDRLRASEARGVLRRLSVLLRPHRGRVARGLIAALVQVGCTLTGPLLVRFAIDHGIVDDDPGALNLAALAYAAAAVIGYVAGRQSITAMARVGEDVLRELRVGVFRHVLRQSLGYYEREHTGRLVSRLTSDVEILQELVSQGVVLLVTNTLLAIGVVVVMVAMSPLLALCVLLVVPVVVLASVRFQRRSGRAYLVVRERVGATLSAIQEGVAGIRVVQAFGREEVAAQRFREVNEELYRAGIDAARVSAGFFPAVEIANVAAVALVVGVGGWLESEDLVTVGTIAAFLLLVTNLFEPVQQLTQLLNALQQAGAGVHRLFELLDTDPDIDERAGAVDLPERGDLVIEGLTFGYRPGRPVLHDVDVVARSGERVALVGPTGAGKSTLAKVAARLYDPQEGRVSFGGVDLRDATIRSLRARIVVVPQEGHLFAGSVRDNIRVGHPEAIDEEIDAAVARLGLTERLERLPDGLATEVRERGSRLSAGERQLVALARAAVADPAVLVLDEATSNLDPGTERAVEQALERLLAGRTVVVIAHRLSTAERADRIVVVDDGGVAEVGTHEELVARGDRYARLVAAWTRGGGPTGDRDIPEDASPATRVSTAPTGPAVS